MMTDMRGADCSAARHQVAGAQRGTVASVASVVSYPARRARPATARRQRHQHGVDGLLCAGLDPRRANRAVRAAPPDRAAQRGHGGGRGTRRRRAAAGPTGRVRPGGPGVLSAAASVLILLQPRLRALSPRPGAEQSARRLATLFCCRDLPGLLRRSGRGTSARRRSPPPSASRSSGSTRSRTWWLYVAPTWWRPACSLSTPRWSGLSCRRWRSAFSRPAAAGAGGQHPARHLPVGVLRIAVALAWPRPRSQARPHRLPLNRLPLRPLPATISAAPAASAAPA